MSDHVAIDPTEGGPPPLLGRDREMRSLEEGLVDAAHGRGSLYLITGESGIGKTRLADAFTSVARRSGATVAWGRCWEEGGAPAFWPWAQILRSIHRELGPSVANALTLAQRHELARVVPEIGDPVQPGPDVIRDPSDNARFELFAAVSATLVKAAGDRPLVVILDDLHAADEPSLLLLMYVAAAIEDVPILVLSIFRDEDLELGDVRTRLLGQVARTRVMRPLQPRGLDAGDVALLIAGIDGAEVSAAVAATIQRETEGNPLFVAELARLLADEDRLREDPAGLEWGVGLSAGVRAVIGRRLARLSDETRSLLADASVLGKEFSLEVFARLEGERPGDLIRRFDPAVRARILVQPLPGGPWRFAHALIREVLYSGIPISDRLALHQAAGEALEAAHVEDRDHYLAELAHHFVEAAPLAGAARAIDYARRAADRASAVYAHEEAARLYRLALGVDTPSGGSEEERVRMLLGLGRAESLSGRVEAAKEAFREAADAAREIGLDEELAQAAIGYGGRFVWLRAGDDVRLVPMLVEALRRLPEDDSPDRVRLLARLSGALRDESPLDRRVAISADALAMARRIDDRRLLGYALVGRFSAIMGPDHIDEMASIRLELANLDATTDDVQMRIQGLWPTLLRYIDDGDDRMALRSAAEAYDRLVEEQRDPALRWSLGVFRTVLALLEGRLADAEALISQTITIGRRVQPWDAGFSELVATVALRREQDRLAEVVDALRIAVPRYPSYPLLGCVLAFVHAATGRQDEARRSVDGMVRDDFRSLPRDIGWAYAMVHLAEAAIALRARDAAAAIATHLAPFASLHASASGEVSAGPVSLTLGRLAAFERRLDAAITYLDAAEAWVTKTGADLWTIRVRVERAAVLLARDASGDDQTARSLLDHCLAQSRSLGLVALERRIDEISATAGTDRHARHQRNAGSPNGGLEGTWRRDGEYWSIRYGATRFRLRDSKGVGYLAVLLSAPGREVFALDLVQGAELHPSRATARATAGIGLHVDSLDSDDVLDRQAITDYRDRIEELQEQVDEADAFSDLERGARARDELDVLVTELGRAMGLGGRSRRGVSGAERARQSVTKAIQAVLRRVREHDPDLAAHLDRSVRTGTFCAYDPDPGLGVSWGVSTERIPA